MKIWILGAVMTLSLQMVATAQIGPNQAGAASGQAVTALRATELRTDKLASSQVLLNLAAGASVHLVSVEGGWALVQVSVAPDKTPLSGWVRAGALQWQSGVSAAATLPSGREAAGNSALTLGVRNLPERVNRHALIIGLSRYADPATPPLPGARIDKASATQMAQVMQVPLSNIRYLQDEQATGNSIRAALQDLNNKVQDGDRVFIHYSGHGTRYKDPAGGCIEALLAYEGGQSGTITNREMADLLKPITTKTDKLFVMYDACHSGGLVQSASSVRTRGLLNDNDEGLLRPKFASISEECGRPVNVKTRNLVVEATSQGVLSQDIIHMSASRDNEISFDDEQKGGLATQYMRDCMLRDAKDLDNSGAISIDEIRQCAQQKIDKRMANDANFKPHNLVLSGNSGFVPAWFSQISASTLPAPQVLALAAAKPPPV
ncbi:MAG: caspase family protein, partial [Betaproteobacteria bacterium]|nr:caspase family protein [Betaproteobacteria bacterium]